MMREKIKKVVLAVATLVIMAGMFEGHTMKAYSETIYTDPVTGTTSISFTPAEDAAGITNQHWDDVLAAQGLGGYTDITPVNGSAPAVSTPTTPATSAPAQPAPTQAPKTTPTKTPEAPKEKVKVTATFKNLYGVIIGTSKITKGTDIAKSQFPKKVPDIETSKGTYVFERWDYDGNVLTDDISVKAVYKLVNK